jgi:hypothetical protein
MSDACGCGDAEPRSAVEGGEEAEEHEPVTWHGGWPRARASARSSAASSAMSPGRCSASCRRFPQDLTRHRRAGVEVARHQRSWVRHRTVTDPAHELARKVMRAFAAAIADDDDVEVRDLSVYDRATGVA